MATLSASLQSLRTAQDQLNRYNPEQSIDVADRIVHDLSNGRNLSPVQITALRTDLTNLGNNVATEGANLVELSNRIAALQQTLQVKIDAYTETAPVINRSLANSLQRIDRLTPCHKKALAVLSAGIQGLRNLVAGAYAALPTFRRPHQA